jgi:hypothetical protein
LFAFGIDPPVDSAPGDVPSDWPSVKVSNADYLEFVNQGAEPPHYWVKRKCGWGLRTIFRRQLWKRAQKTWKI